MDTYELVPVASAAKGRQAPVAKPEGCPALGGHGNLEARLARERGHLNGASEGRERELDRDLAEEIVALALEELVLLHREDDVEVAGVPARGGRLAISG